MNTVLFGNGFNYFSEGFESWASLVSNIELGRDEDHMPFTLQYESKVFEKQTPQGNAEEQILSDICKKIKKISSNDFYERLVKMQFDNYITTNYDHAIEKAFTKAGFKKKATTRTGKYSIRRKKEYSLLNRTANVWHIHGDVDAQSSIMLGYDFYGSYLSQIKRYIDGAYKYDNNKISISVGPLKTRLIQGIELISWIDLFLTSNIHIIAFALYYDEIHLWWLLIKRKKIIDDLGLRLIPNKIYYYGNVGKGKKQLLECLGVEIVDYESNPVKPSGYKKMYDYFLNEIDKRL